LTLHSLHLTVQRSLFSVSRWRQRGLVIGRGAGLVIERLRNLGSTPDAVSRRCVLGKDT